MKTIFYLLVGLLFFSSCEEAVETPDPNIYGYDYYPLEIGNEWIYRVDSTVYYEGGNDVQKDTSFIKEEVTELLSNDNGEKTYRLERSIRKKETDQWQFVNVLQVSIDDARAYRTENNLRFIKLVFPALRGVKWDGNLFFDSDEAVPVGADFIRVYKDWTYKIEDDEASRTLDSIAYDKLLYVSHISEESLIDKRLSEEYYALGIGLVEKHIEILETQNANTSLAWIDRAQKGIIYNQYLVSFTKN